MRAFRRTAVLLLLLIAPPLRAQIAPAEYAARRALLAEHIGDGAVLAFGAREPVSDDAAFRQLPSFEYLTGFAEPDAAFLLVARGGRIASAVLFAPPKNARTALYTGFLPDSAVLVRELGLGITPLPRLRPLVDSLVTAGVPLWTIPDIATRDALRSDSLTRNSRFLEQLRAAHPELRPRNAFQLLDSMRVRKSPAEQALLRRAIGITVRGFQDAFQAVRPNLSEGVVQAAVEYRWRVEGSEGPAFRSIVGSGPNSTSYHYSANRRTMRAGDVVVMDLGALYHGYAADVTRTAPVSGRWTPEQRSIYELVRASQVAAEKVAGPGARVAAGDSAIRRVQADGLARLGLIESPEAVLDAPWARDCTAAQPSCRQAFLYMAHGPGHGIGLEVHDVGGYSYSQTGRFQEGEIFTIEPGIYISTQLLDMLPDTPRNRAFIERVRAVVQRYDNIGIRIEDDYLVTSSGVEWLSRAPREAAEIERAMRPAVRK